MKGPRFHVDAPWRAGEELPLPEAVAHHALRVLRLRDGEPITLFSGQGGEAQARLRIDGKRAFGLIESVDAVERESPLALTLVQSLVASDKLDWVIEKATELGATRVIVAPAARSVIKLEAARLEKRLAHWREIAVAACCQCGRNRIPVIDYFPALTSALAAAESEQRYVLAPGATRPLQLAGARSAAFAVGPEGGFTEDELHAAEAIGYARSLLGSRVLRTETAGLAALAAGQALAGDFVALR
ncbi:MAG: 16S rRNA (uracil(1498)-N(3))-methyltransferase [Burkholderiaceae bacterium]